ncbi:MAG TPA: ATP phosphoribosyltransferase regulatory subunit [Candidatus Cloacimonadota bacterium]|nr:ATP phosphoribosyltransferase regulatory subunit [Candidatus Cloacimonadota bacterium]
MIHRLEFRQGKFNYWLAKSLEQASEAAIAGSLAHAVEAVFYKALDKISLYYMLIATKLFHGVLMSSESTKCHKIMPEEVWLWKIIEEQIEQELALHDYQEIHLSVLQDYTHFKQSRDSWAELCPGSNIFHNSLRVCRPDQAQSSLSLRPEGTISVLHSTAATLHNGDIKRYYYQGPMFRLDQDSQPMEFYQLGVELIGSASVLADSEIISLGFRLCKSLGLGDVSLRLNNYGCPQCRHRYLTVLKDHLQAHKQDYCHICLTALNNNPFAQTNCLDPDCRKSLMGSLKLTDYLCDECKDNYARIKKIQANLAHSYECDPYLLKDYSYYGQTVFDFVLKNNGSSIVLGGGGRYDELSLQMFGKVIPAVGFSLNIDTIFEVLLEREIHNPSKSDFSVYLCTQSENMEMMMLQIANELHSSGVKTVLAMDEEQDLDRQILKASAKDCSLLFSLREDNIRDGKVLLYNLAKEHQEYVALTQLTDAVLLARKALINQ